MFYSKEFKHNDPLKNHIHIFNENLSCKIYPDLGASLQSLISKNIKIIYGIDSLLKPSDVYTIHPSALLFPFPGRVENGTYFFNEKKYQFDQNEQDRTNAIHGLVAHQSFTLVHSETTKNNATFSFQYSAKNAAIGFPYDFDFTIHYIITEKQILLDFEILNTGIKTFPFAIGWHPYFNSNQLSKDTLTFQTSQEVLCNKEMIPTGKKEIENFKDFTINNTHFDTCYVLNQNNVTLNTKKYKAQIQIGHQNQQYLQVFTPSSRDCIAIEPMSCMPDAFNNREGLLELPPDSVYHYKVNLNLEVHD
ncbi:MAG: aldose 1-epimerase [Flavobacteriaceae bacterium]